MPLALLKEDMSAGKIVGLLFLEAAVIFAGITSSFWMEEWRETRQDLDTYDHLLEEIYLNSRVDEGTIPPSIASNNLALKYALEISVLDKEVASDRELFEELSHAFSGFRVIMNTTGFERLGNTALSIPFDETLLTLDNAHASFSDLRAGIEALDEQMTALRREHWSSAGLVSCSGRRTDDGSISLMDRPYMAEIRTMLYPDGACIVQAGNEARARQLMARPGFRNALRQVVELRQEYAWLLGWQQAYLDATQASIEARLPGIELPVVSMELMYWPADDPSIDAERRAAMRAAGDGLWRVTLDLPDGYIKFRANQDWTLNWGAPFPNIIDAPRILWSSEQVRIEDVFPAGVAAFTGVNLPVVAGRYLVTFDDRSGEYSFLEVEAAP